MERHLPTLAQLNWQLNKLDTTQKKLATDLLANSQRVDAQDGQMAALTNALGAVNDEMAAIRALIAQQAAAAAAPGTAGGDAPHGAGANAPPPAAVRESAAGSYYVAIYPPTGPHTFVTLDDLELQRLHGIYNDFNGRVKKSTQSMIYHRGGYTRAHALRSPRITLPNGNYLTLTWGKFVTYLNRRLEAAGQPRLPTP